MVAGLIALNVVVYVWEMSSRAGYFSYAGIQGPCAHMAVCDYGLLPAAVHHGQWYRLITAAFLHANIEHIAFNMFALAIVGAPIEAELGRVRFGALYLVSALGGSVASYLLSHANQIGVGASGAIFGLMGAYFVIARRRAWETGTIVALIVLNLLVGFAAATIDWRAHVGGLVTGAIVSAGMIALAPQRSRHSGPQVAAGVAIAAVIAVALSMLVVVAPPGQVNL